MERRSSSLCQRPPGSGQKLKDRHVGFSERDHLTMAPLLFVLLVVPLLPVEPLLRVPSLLVFSLLPLPPSGGVQDPPGRPTQLFG